MLWVLCCRGGEQAVGPFDCLWLQNTEKGKNIALRSVTYFFDVDRNTVKGGQCTP